MMESLPHAYCLESIVGESKQRGVSTEIVQ